MFSTTLIYPLLLALFLFGLGIGYIYSRDAEETQAQKIRIVIAIVVTVVWVGAMVADVFLTGYAISPLVHAIMGAVVGYFFADKGLDINIGG